jgi:hypothetical protein
MSKRFEINPKPISFSNGSSTLPGISSGKR